MVKAQNTVLGYTLAQMIPLPKPGSILDYALFALPLWAFFAGLFWVQAGYRVGRGDAVFAFLAAVLFVLAISILARQSEKTKRIVRSIWQAKLLLVLGTGSLIFSFLYADLYFIHHIRITASRLHHDAALGVVLSVGMFLSFRSGIAASGRHLH